MLTLHPQSAMEHLHARFVAADGAGLGRGDRLRGDRGRPRPAGPHARPGPAGRAAGRRPGPLADPAGRQRPGGRRAAVTAAAGNARGRRRRGVRAGRRPRSRTSCPGASRPTGGSRPSPRGARPSAGPRSPPSPSITVVGGLGLAVYAFGGDRDRQEAISSVNAGQAALDRPRRTSPRSPGPGIDLVEDDPEQALELLTEAYEQLDVAEAAEVSARVVDPLRAEVVGRPRPAVRRRPGRQHATLFTFAPEEGAEPFDLAAMVRGPDGAPYVIDADDQDRLPGRPQARAGRRPSCAQGREVERHDRRRADASWRSAGATCSSSTPRTCCGAGGRPNDAGKGTLDRGQRQRRDPVGRRHHGHRHVPAGRRARPLQPVRRRPVRAADPGLPAGRRRQRLPGQGRAAGWRPPGPSTR